MSENIDEDEWQDSIDTGRNCEKCRMPIYRRTQPIRVMNDGLGGELMLLQVWFECECGWSNESAE